MTGTVYAEDDPDPLPDIIIQVAVPDTVDIWDRFDVTIKVWNMEDTTVVVTAFDSFFDPSLGWYIGQPKNLTLTANRDTTYAGLGSPHLATLEGTWKFSASVSFAEEEGDIIDRDYRETVVIE